MSNGLAAIQTTKLSKRYASAKTFSLQDLSLEVQHGEIYGFLGPNGSGKSTTIRLLLNFIQPTSGTIQINGLDAVEQAVSVRREVGYVTGDGALYDKLTGREFLDYIGALHPGFKRSYRDELVKRLKVDLKKKIGSLSRGNKQKIALVQAFAHQPKILILDEPSSGLDPLMQEVFYDLLQEAKSRQATVFMSSHILAEVQRVCDRVGIIREGRLVSEQRIVDLENKAAQTFEIFFAGEAPLKQLRKLEGAKMVKENSDGSVGVHIHGDLTPLLSLLSKHKVKKLFTRELDLEQEFLQFYQSEDKS